MCVVAGSPRGHNYVIIGRDRGLRAATAEEAGCRGLHGLGGYDQENDNNKKSSFWSGLGKIIGSNLKGRTDGRGWKLQGNQTFIVTQRKKTMKNQQEVEHAGRR